MEPEDIRRVQADWARAARQARSVGFDIVYVYGGHSYLLTQFLSPFYNKRTDEYGGSLENRARMWLETLEARARGRRRRLRDRRSHLVSTPSDRRASSSTRRSSSCGSPTTSSTSGTSTSARSPSGRRTPGVSRFFAEGYQLEWTGRVREATPKPIVGVGRFTNPDRMAEVIASGALDLIGAARPSIADPFLPQKIEEGRYGEIRECIGCNVCISKSETRPSPRLHPERDRRRGVPARLASRALRAGGERRP